nr:hypothetical protein GCM10020092_083930 [Actinoplanes digitatis]
MARRRLLRSIEIDRMTASAMAKTRKRTGLSFCTPSTSRATPSSTRAAPSQRPEPGHLRLGGRHREALRLERLALLAQRRDDPLVADDVPGPDAPPGRVVDRRVQRGGAGGSGPAWRRVLPELLAIASAPRSPPSAA